MSSSSRTMLFGWPSMGTFVNPAAHQSLGQLQCAGNPHGMNGAHNRAPHSRTDMEGQWRSLTWHVDEGEVGDIGGEHCQLDGLRRHRAALPFEIPVCLCLDLVPDGLCRSSHPTPLR